MGETANVAPTSYWHLVTRRVLDRLTGLPLITVRYRGHWRIMVDAHRMILALIEDSQRGRRARRIAETWLREDER